VGRAVGVRNLGRASVRRVRAVAGLNSGAGSSLRKVTELVIGLVPPFKDREVDSKPRGGSIQPEGVLERGGRLREAD